MDSSNGHYARVLTNIYNVMGSSSFFDAVSPTTILHICRWQTVFALPAFDIVLLQNIHRSGGKNIYSFNVQGDLIYIIGVMNCVYTVYIRIWQKWRSAKCLPALPHNGTSDKVTKFQIIAPVLAMQQRHISLELHKMKQFCISESVFNLKDLL